MKAVILDAETLGSDVDLSPLEAQLTGLHCYARTEPENVLSRLQGADIAISNKVVLDQAVLAQLPDLKLICVLATGTNNVDGKAAAEQGIEVSNVVAYGSDSVAQHTLMLTLYLAGQQPRYQREIRQGHWQKSPQFCLMQYPTLQLSGKSAVIVGQGELGTRVASLYEAFGMKVSFAARPGKTDDKRQPLDKLVQSADVISLHCPLTAETNELINASLLSKTKRGCLLVNCARGGLINEADALKALREGILAGLAVDVLNQEPPRGGHIFLDAMQEDLNLIVTPHHAWISPEARQTVVQKTAENVTRFLATYRGR
ncbi:glycerate dehydrogenase [Pseudohongiella nitratireducens]|uniref:Glycerate dehydrogenase n=1 Tax=Pseudohongiella nitratireducens TaxID=1768907 RepID=A0A917GJ92_9GAMM|nr:D-2-hydroxyacid dehydrogenase [Pseudohongiella nitratireducens]MDF1624511.1 D-2-hydroxyacid dehydrogenase [Pseudohongiella nitratireducens]GGG47976.1 glycerate dehydrogenase [Pseudohongiella nitratireducens]|tara:strand:- start:3491 stop:4435 length:945 start_codon:yes stop_codon:yes gene_type:complete